MNHKLTYYLFLLQATIFAVGNVITKFAYESITPFLVSFFQVRCSVLDFYVFWGKKS